MMKLSWALCLAVTLVTSVPSIEGTFLRDVIQGKKHAVDSVEDMLLAKAVPVDQYRENLKAQGMYITSESRKMEEDGGDGGGGDDDYFMNDKYMYSFSGFSVKYAKCQPVQRFSENAIEAGEFTPMVTNDVVILRLCPNRLCSSSRSFGCHYNFAEYAIDLSDYLRIMMRYKMDKEEKLCDWCNSCYMRRRMEEDAAGDDGAADEAQEEQVEEQADEEQADEQADEAADAEEEAEAQDDDGAYANNNANSNNEWWSGNNYYNDDVYGADDDCYGYSTYCVDSNGNFTCTEDDGQDDDYLMTFEGYFDYLDCVQEGDYYVRPRCDGYTETIKMAIFYDPFCSQYAGNDINMNQLGLGFNESEFVEFYENTQCIDCSESNTGPHYSTASYMCNQIHANGARCTLNLQYDLFDNDNTYQSSECSFIESVRFGNYDEEGRLYTAGSDSENVTRTITGGQKFGLVISLGICAALAFYSCYLHHAITNILVKSISHTELLPPSRARKNSSSSSNRSSYRRNRRSSSKRKDEDEDEEWVHADKEIS